MVRVPPPKRPGAIGSATAASATMSIEVRRSGIGRHRDGVPVAVLNQLEAAVPEGDDLARATPGSAPAQLGTVAAVVPLVLPTSVTSRRPAVALRRRCRRDSSGIGEEEPVAVPAHVDRAAR